VPSGSNPRQRSIWQCDEGGQGGMRRTAQVPLGGGFTARCGSAGSMVDRPCSEDGGRGWQNDRGYAGILASDAGTTGPATPPVPTPIPHTVRPFLLVQFRRSAHRLSSIRVSLVVAETPYHPLLHALRLGDALCSSTVRTRIGSGDQRRRPDTQHAMASA